MARRQALRIRSVTRAASAIVAAAALSVGVGTAASALSTSGTNGGPAFPTQGGFGGIHCHKNTVCIVFVGLVTPGGGGEGGASTGRPGGVGGTP